MAVKIIIDIFSGRPNPVLFLDDDEAEELLEMTLPVTSKSERNASNSNLSSAPILGYRGLIVEHIGLKPRSQPSTNFKIFNGTRFDKKNASNTKDPHVEDFLLSRVDFLGRMQLEGHVRNWVAQQVLSRKAPPPFLASAKKLPSIPSTGAYGAPRYEPNWWNDSAAGGSKESTNNCYNYATNYLTDTFARPGVGSGQTYPFPTSSKGVRDAAIRDGLLEKWATQKSGGQHTLVALFVSPGIDFHWYRLDSNGYWSHKPGVRPVTNLDNDGKLITDPRTAARGVYTEFGGFMLAVQGHFKIR